MTCSACTAELHTRYVCPGVGNLCTGTGGQRNAVLRGQRVRGGNEAAPEGGAGRGRAGADAELGQNAGDVPLRGAPTDEERLADLLVGQAFGEQMEHVHLARGQIDSRPPAPGVWHGRRLRSGETGTRFGDRLVDGELPA